MIKVPVSYNGTSLQSTDYTASFPRAKDDLQPPVDVKYIKRTGAWPVMSGKDFGTAIEALEIECSFSSPGYMAQFENLNQLFDVQDETPRQFIIKDTSDSDKQYYVYGTPKRPMGGDEGPRYYVELALDDPVYQSVTQNSQTFAVTGTTDSTSVTAAGNADSYPIFEITPTLGSTDYPYSSYLQVLGTSTDTWNNRFLDIMGSTDTTWDTAALIAAGKMQATGADIRVFRNGIDWDYWLDGINTTDTHIIVNGDVFAATNMTLKTAIGATDTVTEIELNYTTINKNLISAIPNVGRLILDASIGATDTEEFTYTARTITDTKLSFTTEARAVRQTVAVAHAANGNVRFLLDDWVVVYGNPGVAAKVTDDNFKPIQALTSRNNSLIYTAFPSSISSRPGIWNKLTYFLANPSISESGYYASTEDSSSAASDAVLGMRLASYQIAGNWRADSAHTNWRIRIPDGISTLAVNGAQFQTDGSSQPKFYMGTAVVSNVIPTLFQLAAQVSTDYGTWTAWSKATTDYTIPADTKYLYWTMQGTSGATASLYSRAEISGMTIGITNPPHVMIRPEPLTGYKLDAIIRNETTGEFIKIVYPMELNETLIIDTDPNFPTAKYKGQMVNGAVSLSSIRAAWLKLQPGANTIGFETQLAVASTVSIAIKWRDRVNQL